MNDAVILAGVLGLAAFIAIVRWPLLGACLFIFANPLIVGIARGQMGLALRPNEVLLLFILAALGMRTLLLMLGGRSRSARFDRMDLVLLGMVGTGSVLPLLWRVARDLPLSADDLLYALVLVKYYALFRFFRAAVVDSEAVATCLRVSMIAAGVVAVVAILQVTHQLGTPEFLFSYYDQPFEGAQTLMTDRGTSTVASAFGVGDLMIMNLIMALALIRTKRHGWWLLAAASVLFASGCIVAGEFSGYIGLAIALFTFGVLTGTLFRLVPIGTVVAGIAAVAFWQVIERRLVGFESQSGLPHSWTGRWQNLERYFFPELFSGANWLLGVRPAPRVIAPETWRSMVYIESGYVWLLWIGGLPFLAAFVWFVTVSLRRLYRVAQARTDAVGCAAITGFCSVVFIVVLMLLDPHLTLRGSADLFFPILALSLVPEGNRRTSLTSVDALPGLNALPEGRRIACAR